MKPQGEKSPLELQKRWFRELWEERNEALIDEMIDEECVVLGLPEIPMKGPELFRLFYKPVTEAFAHTSVVIDDYMEQGDKVFHRCTATFTTHDGQSYSFGGAGLARFRNGKYIEAWNAWDWLYLFAQMGVCGLDEKSFMDVMAELKQRAA